MAVTVQINEQENFEQDLVKRSNRGFLLRTAISVVLSVVIEIGFSLKMTDIF